MAVNVQEGDATMFNRIENVWPKIIFANAAKPLKSGTIFNSFPLPLPAFKMSVMGNRREFDIAFVGLKPGIHEFSYEVDDKFFTAYREADFTNCKANIKLTLEKNTSFMMLKFEVGGKVDVICDRCGNTLTLELWDEFNMIIKLVENPEEMNETEEDPDIYYISRTESHLHIADWIYEFVSLSIPYQRSCKEDEIGGPQCNKEVLEMLKKMESGSNENNNPLLKELEKFKNKN